MTPSPPRRTARRWLVLGSLFAGLVAILLFVSLSWRGSRSLPLPGIAAPPPTARSGDPQISRGPTPAPTASPQGAPDGSPPQTYEFEETVVTGELIKPAPADETEAALENLQEGILAFNVPPAMRVGETRVVQLVVRFGRDSGIGRAVTEPGAVETAPVKVASAMEAKLSGSDSVEIAAVTPEEQLMSRREITEWRWNVTPRREGTHRLQLAVSAIVRVQATEKRRTLKVYSREIDVTADPLFQRPWVLAGLGAAVVIALGAAGVRLRRARQAGFRPRPSAAAGSEDPIDLFVSYSRRDLPTVGPIVTALERRGLRVWLDVQGIEGATQWAEEIAHAIRRSRAVVLMGSPDAFASAFVTREVALGIEEGKPIIPVELAPADAPAKLKLHLAGMQRIAFDPAATERTAGAIERAFRRSTGCTEPDRPT